MKTKKYILKGLATCLIAASLSACVDLEPKAMSFLTPENTLLIKQVWKPCFASAVNR